MTRPLPARAAPQRLVILGGSFDPVHAGHLAVLQQARIALEAQMGWLLPTGVQPLRRPAHATVEDRLAMASAAVRGRSDLGVSDLEARRPGRSYTVDTAALLAAELPAVERWWLLGADAARRIGEWRRWEELLERERFALVNRAGVAAMGRAEAERLGFAEERTRLLELDAPQLSASQVRRRLALGASVEGLLPDAVIALIKQRGLYGAGAAQPGDNDRDDLR